MIWLVDIVGGTKPYREFVVKKTKNHLEISDDVFPAADINESHLSSSESERQEVCTRLNLSKFTAKNVSWLSHKR